MCVCTRVCVCVCHLTETQVHSNKQTYNELDGVLSSASGLGEVLRDPYERALDVEAASSSLYTKNKGTHEIIGMLEIITKQLKV